MKQENLPNSLILRAFYLIFWKGGSPFSVNITLKGDPPVLQFYGANYKSTGENHPDEKRKPYIYLVRNWSHVLPGEEIYDPCGAQHRKA